MYGWHHKLLRVDLTNHKVSIEDIDPKISKDYIGGRGVAMRYLYDEVDPQVRPPQLRRTNSSSPPVH